MKMNLQSAVAISCVISTLSCAADDIEKNRNAEHSVRDTIATVTLSEKKEISIVDKFKNMFEKGKVSGNIRSIYSQLNNENDADTYVTAVGGSLKYELAAFYGWNAGVGFQTTNDINAASKKKDADNTDLLSGSAGVHNELSEAYINYALKNINIRIGRQVIDTPLVDSDDIRMSPNTFEAYALTYTTEQITFMAAHINAWQGYDAGLDDSWVKTGKNGVNMSGLSYSNALVDVSLWYYNFSNASAAALANGADANGNNSVYTDISGHFSVADGFLLHASLQYLHQNELDNSGVKADIYGTMGQISYDNLTLSIAYNISKKQKGKHSFSGYGGGTLYTSMDTMILDEITEDRKADAVMSSISYTLWGIDMFYAYGDFKGAADSSGAKEHIVAQNIGIEYTTEGKLTLSSIYDIHTNKEASSSTFYNDTNFRILASYNF